MRNPFRRRTKPAATATAPPAMTAWARNAHGISIIVMAIGVIAATSVGFTQSWAGLYGWGIDHGLTEWKAVSFPAMVDTFIAIGELGLFVLALEGLRLNRGLAWADLMLPMLLASAGWAASVLFNIGHVDGPWQNKLTAAVPPVASMLGLFVLLRTLHRLVTRSIPESQPPAETFGHLDGRGNQVAEPGPGSEPIPATPAPEAAAGQDLVLDLPEALRAATRGKWSGRKIAEALGVKDREKIYAMLRQADPDHSHRDDDPADTPAAHQNPGGNDDPDAEQIAADLVLDPARVREILRHETDLAATATVNGHHPTGDDRG